MLPNFKLSKLARVKVLLKLEFDTEDHILLLVFYFLCIATLLTLYIIVTNLYLSSKLPISSINMRVFPIVFSNSSSGNYVCVML